MIKKIAKQALIKVLKFSKNFNLLNRIGDGSFNTVELLRSIEQKYIYDICNVNYEKKYNHSEEQNLNFLLLNYSLHIPMFSGRINMGDYVQTLAVKKLLDSTFQTKYCWHDRDSLAFFRKPSSNDCNQICCIMQGWFSLTYNFLPSKDILPIWIGTHFAQDTQTFLQKVLVVNPNYFLSSVGCRDLFTLEFFRKNYIKSYFSRCLTLTYPSRPTNKLEGGGKKVYMVNISKEIMQYMPKNIVNESIIFNQRAVYVNNEHWSNSLIRTQNMLDEYKENAKLVITTALHCACPCIAMGIPVILIAANPEENKTRFSALSGILDPISIDDIKKNKVNWKPEPIDISELKKAMITNFYLSIDEVTNIHQKKSELSDIRDFIENFRIKK